MAERIKYKIIPIVRDWGLFTPRKEDVMVECASTDNQYEAAKRLDISRNTLKYHIYGHHNALSKKDRLGVFGIYKEKTGRRPRYKSWINQIKGDVIAEKSQSLIITHGESKLQNRKI